MTPDASYAQYTNVFRLYIVLLILTNGVFVAFSHASPEPWAIVDGGGGGDGDDAAKRDDESLPPPTLALDDKFVR